MSTAKIQLAIGIVTFTVLLEFSLLASAAPFDATESSTTEITSTSQTTKKLPAWQQILIRVGVPIVVVILASIVIFVCEIICGCCGWNRRSCLCCCKSEPEFPVLTGVTPVRFGVSRHAQEGSNTKFTEPDNAAVQGQGGNPVLMSLTRLNSSDFYYPPQYQHQPQHNQSSQQKLHHETPSTNISDQNNIISITNVDATSNIL